MKGSSFRVIYDAFDGLFAFGLFAIHLFTFRSFAVRSCLFAVLHRVRLPLYVCLLFVHSPLLAAALSSRDSHSVHRTSGTHGTTVLKVEPKYTRSRDVLKYLVIFNFSQVFGGSKKVRT